VTYTAEQQAIFDTKYEELRLLGFGHAESENAARG
jgi:hypothetical protein